MADPFLFAADLDHHAPDLLPSSVCSESGIFAPEMFWSSPEEVQIGGAKGWNGSIPAGYGGDANRPSEKAVRKREMDRKYRQKLKKEQVEMRSQLEILQNENTQLSDENKRLKIVAEKMKGRLEAQVEEINNLKKDLIRFKLEYDKQNALVQSLSDICAKSPHLQLENKRLLIENDLLKSLQVAPPQPTFDELVQLRLQNRILQVQNDALCGKILMQSDHVHQQDGFG